MLDIYPASPCLRAQECDSGMETPSPKKTNLSPQKRSPRSAGDGSSELLGKRPRIHESVRQVVPFRPKGYFQEISFEFPPGQKHTGCVPRGAAEMIPSLEKQLNSGKELDTLLLVLPPELSHKFGLQVVHKLFEYLVDVHYGNPCTLWKICKDYKPRLFLKQPGQLRYSKENDADAHFTKSVDLLILVSFLGLTELREQVLQGVKDTLSAIPEQILKMRKLSESEHVSDLIAPNWYKWSCEALQDFGEYYTKPDTAVFLKLVSLGLEDMLFDANIHRSHLLTLGKSHREALPSPFVERLARHVINRLGDVDSQNVDANAVFLLQNCKQADLRRYVLEQLYPETGTAATLMPAPGVLCECNSTEQLQFCNRLAALASIGSTLTGGILAALTPGNRLVALQYLFAVIANATISESPREDLVAVLTAEEKASLLVAMRRFIEGPSANIVEHTRVAVKFLQAHYFSYSTYDRWMLTQALPHRVVRGLVQEEGSHCRAPVGRALVHRVVHAAALAGLIKKEQFEELSSLVCSSLQRPFLEALRDTERLSKRSEDMVHEELQQLTCSQDK